MTSLQSSAPARHRQPVRPLRIAMIGTRGVQVDDGGLESAVVEVGRRLVRQGHEVVVYGRSTGPAPRELFGMRCVTMPARGAATLAAAHLAFGRRIDVAFVFGAAAAPLIPLLRLRGTAVAVHVDRIAPVGGGARARWAEQIAAREADALVADAAVVQEHYEDEFGVPAEVIAYGARILTHEPSDAIEALGLVPGHFHLVADRIDADAAVDAVLAGYHASLATMPLVVVGAAADAPSVERVRRIAETDSRIRVLGDVRDDRTLDQLHAHALSVLSGRAVAGTNRALLRAMGAGTAVVARDTSANRDVAGTAASYFTTRDQLAASVTEIERYPFRFRDIGELMQERARRRYDWNVVAEAYEALATKLARGYSIRGISDGTRLPRTAIDQAMSRA